MMTILPAACRPLATALLPLALAPWLCGQCASSNQSAGPFAGAPFVFSTVDETVFSTLLKCTGFEEAAEVTEPGRPDIDIARVLAEKVGAFPGPGIDALSFGMDVLLVDDLGVVDVPPGRWGALTFSVTEAATGTSGVVADEVGSPDGAAGDVFSYVFPGSVLSPFGGVVHRAQDASEFWPSGTPVTDLDALDLHGPLWLMDELLFSALKDGRFFVYFSVSNNALGEVPPGWFGPKGPSGASILCMEWSPDTEQWGDPVELYSHEDLGLDIDEDVDALAVDLSGGEPKLLLSTAGPARDQLLVAFPSRDGAAALVVYKSRSGRPVWESLGLQGGDDIDAICDIDPTLADDARFSGGGHRLAGLHPMRFAMGWPVAEDRLGLPVALHASAFVQCIFKDNALQATGSGWPSGVPGTGFAMALLEVPPPTPVLVPLSPIFARSPTPVFCGDPQTARLPLDSAAARALRLSNVAIYLHWVATDGGPIVTSYPLRVHL
ncbi:MAG: hypothetical protein AAF628_29660 [Planctomycetota bacterium]